MIKTGIIKRNRHRSNRQHRPTQNGHMDQGYTHDSDHHEERLDYRPARNRVVLQQNIDKYLNLAREAMNSSDRVQAENFLQHADHFNRLLNEQKEIKQQSDQKRMQHINNSQTSAQNAQQAQEDNTSEDNNEKVETEETE